MAPVLRLAGVAGLREHVVQDVAVGRVARVQQALHPKTAAVSDSEHPGSCCVKSCSHVWMAALWMDEVKSRAKPRWPSLV